MTIEPVVFTKLIQNNLNKELFRFPEKEDITTDTNPSLPTRSGNLLVDKTAIILDTSEGKDHPTI